MPVFRVTSPDGAAYDVTAPDGASEQDALAVAQAHHNALTQLASLGASNSGVGNAQIGSAASVPPSSTLNDEVRALARGVPVAGAYLDELDAATNATISPLIPNWLADAIPGDTWKQRYLASLAMQRGEDQAYDNSHPLQSLLLRFAGGAATGGAAMKAAPAITRTALGMLGPSAPTWLKSLTGAASGAGLSALHGFGEGEGGFDERLNNAKNSLLWGGAVGSLIPPLARAAGDDITNYAGSNALTDDGEQAAETALGAGTVPIPPPYTGWLQHLLSMAAGANPAVAGQRQKTRTQ